MYRITFFILLFIIFIQGCSNSPSKTGEQPHEKLESHAKEIQSDKPVVMFILDISGSMNKNDVGGARIEKAKETLINTVSQLDTSRYNTGLITFGGSCTTKLVTHPTGSIEKVINTTKAIQASGGTPLAQAISFSGDLLKNIKNRMIILLSDGKETCSGDPVYEAKKLHKKYGIDINFQIIGYAIDESTRKELKKISKVSGHWKYHDAKDSISLKKAVDTIFSNNKLRDTSWVTPKKYVFDFNTGSSNLRNTYLAKIEKMYNYLRNNTNSIKIIGHTDSTGTVNSNYILSNKRALIIKEKLINLGIDENRIAIEGKGESSPIASNKNENGRKMNRRVEILIIKE